VNLFSDQLKKKPELQASSGLLQYQIRQHLHLMLDRDRIVEKQTVVRHLVHPVIFNRVQAFPDRSRKCLSI
jgi:hypothetical protein